MAAIGIRVAGPALVGVLLSGFLVACTDTAAVCTDVNDLEGAVQGLRDVTIEPGALPEIHDQLAEIGQQLTALHRDAKSEYADEVDALTSAANRTKADAAAARANLNATTLSALRASVGGLVDATTGLVDSVSQTCRSRSGNR